MVAYFMNAFTVSDLTFFSGSIADVVERIYRWIKINEHSYICVTGAHGVVEAHSKLEVLQAHQNAGLVVPDGMPLVWLGKLLGRPNTERIYGPDLFLALCERAEKEKWRVFLYGTTAATIERLRKQLHVRFPGLVIAGSIAPPFRPLLPDEEKRVSATITDSRADIVFVGLSTPKQELWMQKHSPKLKAHALIGVGAAFDFVSGTKKQAPQWMRGFGLEWAFRLFQEPRRLWYRSVVLNGVFIGIALKTIINARSGKKIIAGIFSSIISLIILVVMLAGAEALARFVTNNGTISYYKPIQIQVVKDIGEEKEDWRLTYMMQNENFIPDSQLLWKSKPGVWRFNDDGYVGKIKRSDIEKAHADGGCVIVAFGDSNTQGIESASWPEEMNAMLEAGGYRSRVVNAGVAGYSSHQGKIKFFSDMKIISPTHVFISFGWNDVAPTMGAPDSSFISSHSPNANILYNMRLYGIIQALFQKPQEKGQYAPRVSLNEYERNLMAMISEAKKKRVYVILITRPYNSTDYLYWKTLSLDQGGWRVRVADYNSVVRRVAHEQSVGLWDMEQITALRVESFIDDSHYSAETYKEMAKMALQEDNIRTQCK